MPVHSVIIVNRAGNVLFSKYFDSRVTGGKQYVFEQEVFSHTSFMWHQTSKQTVSIKDVHIVYQRCGDLIIFIGGTNEVDEIILAEALDCLIQIVEEADAKAEKQFLDPEKYGKWIIAIDEMMPQGYLENTDADRVLKLSKLKHV